jgi:hypothetical protein
MRRGHTNARASTDAVHESDREGSPARSSTVGLWVGVEAEQTAPPVDEQPDREVGDDESDRGLSRLLDPAWQEPVEDDDG